ncbi:MAG: molecular chaperone DnaK, partial [Lentisphaeria bacterium]|nr:molecular chaperone DnaK [Lentisphaeria bacterium]
KQLKEYGDKISVDVKRPVEDGLAKLKQQLQAEDVEGMKATMQNIENDLMKFGQEIYQQQQAQGQTQGQAQGAADNDNKESKGGDDVVDAEIVD